jgi:hypothetical protein
MRYQHGATVIYAALSETAATGLGFSDGLGRMASVFCLMLVVALASLGFGAES